MANGNRKGAHERLEPVPATIAFEHGSPKRIRAVENPNLHTLLKGHLRRPRSGGREGVVPRPYVAQIDDEQIDCIITTGGTGLTGRDVTPEALDKVKSKDVPGFGELFRWISFDSIGTSTVQSRACAVLARGTYIFALPGSNGAVKDGWDQILALQLDSRHRPCNFVELMPRLRER